MSEPVVSSGDVRAVLLVGGEGLRLRPFTATLPKPLMPLGDRTILEMIVEQLRAGGIRRISLAVNHLAPLIMAYFGDGSKFDVEIDYLHEPRPLGTAGPIGGLASPDDATLLVMNGDVLTDLDFGAFVASHRARGAGLTVATQSRSFEVEFGVVRSDAAGRIVGLDEKPSTRHRISIGIYAVEPRVRAMVTPGDRLDMPELVMRAVGAGEEVVAHDHPGLWLDIGRPADLARAQDLVARGWPDVS